MKSPDSSYATSKNQNNLWFPDIPPGSATYFEHAFGTYVLEGRILYNDVYEEPWVFSIHGARADFTKSDAVAFGLQRRGYSMLGMNLSGHSKSSPLAPEQTSLGNNVREAEAFYQYLSTERKITVIGYSLGGTLALKLLEKHSADIDKLVLFYPGIFTKDAYDKHYGSEFRAAITKPFSYRENDTVELLRSFKGKVLLIKGQYDGLDPEAYGKSAGGAVGDIEIDGDQYYSPIPKEVIDLVFNTIPEAQRQYIEIPNCGHSIVLWMRDHPVQAKELLDQIDTFLKS